MFVYLLLIIFPFLYAMLLDKPRGFVSRLFFSSAIFLGVNSFYFLFVYILKNSLNINFLPIIHLICLAIWFFLVKSQFLNKSKKEIFTIDSTDIGLIFLTFLTCIVFYQATISFKNGVRLPIFSYTQDAANHLIWTKNIVDSNNLEIAYPLGFHSNAWIAEMFAKELTNNIAYDQVVFVNSFSIFIIFIMILITGLLYLVLDSLLMDSKNNKNIFLKLILAFLVFSFGTIIPYYFIGDGFYSTWFNQIFLLAIVIFFLNNVLDSFESFFILLIFIVGFIYSYIYFVPALFIFFIIILLSSKDKRIFFLLFTTFLISFLLILRYLGFGGNSTVYLVSARGWFVDFPILLVSAYIIPAICYFYFFPKNNEKNNILVYFGVSFSLFSLALASYQLFATNSLQYSFYKTLSVCILIFSIFSISGFYKLYFKLYEKLKTYLYILSFSTLAIIYLIFRVIPYLDTSNYQFFSKGNLNFLENNKDKYNAISYIEENVRNFDKYIYIDSDYSSGQWGNKLLEIGKLSIINKNTNDGFNASNGNLEKYLEVILNLKDNEKLLIIDPVRYLQVNCEAEEFITESTTSGKNISYYPSFNLDVWIANCKKNSK